MTRQRASPGGNSHIYSTVRIFYSCGQCCKLSARAVSVFRYSCVKASTAVKPPPAPPVPTGPPPPANSVLTTGKPYPGNIARTSDHVLYSFHATKGKTYKIETQLGTLKDTAITLIDRDAATILLENDDADADSLGDAKASFMEWTCPVDGTYFAQVRGTEGASGTFQISIKQSGSAQIGSASGNPCGRGGAHLSGAGVISFHAYPNNAHCEWAIQCAHGKPQLHFTKFDTEANKDYVVLYEGASADQSMLGTESGSFVDLQMTHFTAKGAKMTVQFTSDAQTPASGFVAHYTCHRTTVPPPPPAVLPPTADLSFSVKMCVDHIDDLYFQDSRIWLQYGGVWGAAGTGCGAMNGKAIVSVNGKHATTWDISALAHCQSGHSCPPVSLDLAAQGFKAPECASVVTTVKKTAGRGAITVPVQPSAGNSFRGEIEFNDNNFDGRQVYEAQIKVSCADKKQNGGRHYVFVPKDPFTGGKTWHEAQDYCLSKGMTLANIHNNADQQAAMKASGGKGGWIGLTDDNHDMKRDSCPGAPGCSSVRSSTEGKFVFTDGTFIGSMANKKWTPNHRHFSYWGANEPNEAGSGEDCVHLFSSGKWNDAACDSKRSFICGPKTHGIRLACDNTIGSGTCHQGRLEVLNPYNLKWGTVCGTFHLPVRSMRDRYTLCILQGGVCTQAIISGTQIMPPILRAKSWGSTQARPTPMAQTKPLHPCPLSLATESALVLSTRFSIVPLLGHQKILLACMVSIRRVHMPSTRVSVLRWSLSLAPPPAYTDVRACARSSCNHVPATHLYPQPTSA